MTEPIEWETERQYVLNTRPLLNFGYRGRVDLLDALLGRPILVPSVVVEQVEDARSAIDKELRDIPQLKHDLFDVNRLHHLEQTLDRFSDDPFRKTQLSPDEQNLAHEIRESHRLIDPGEAEILAMCQLRGTDYVAIMDDRPAHELAVDWDIPTYGTIELLIGMVQAGLLEGSEGEQLLDEMRISWPRGPGGHLQEYIHGSRPVW